MEKDKTKENGLAPGDGGVGVGGDGIGIGGGGGVGSGGAGGGDSRKTVYIASCPTYERQAVEAAVAEAVAGVGGWEKFVQPGQTVLVKPNLLYGASPDRCITTHPEVVYAVAKALKELGCRVVIADSPGSAILHQAHSIKKVYDAAGMTAVATELGVELNLDTRSEQVRMHSTSGGRMQVPFQVMTPVLTADAVVVVSKAKTHGFTYLSGAAKNLFGVIPGLEKTGFHARFPDRNDFARMLVDLNELIKPRLQVVDAVVGMEGEGPSGGEKRHIGAILVGADYTAVDVALARIMSMDPARVGTIAAAVERGLVSPTFEDISFIPSLEPYIIPDFVHPSTYTYDYAGDDRHHRPRTAVGRIVSQRWRKLRHNSLGMFGRLYLPRPVLLADKCVGCGDCRRSCPVKAINWQNNRPEFKYKTCIKCYCCQEMCRKNAIKLEVSLLRRLMRRLPG
ncbi:MAG TPA: DUF362 domain-containing protein [Firmicutes bacterium]|nr:DUF362 domain-containing protein [Bacillota bacterium]